MALLSKRGQGWRWLASLLIHWSSRLVGLLTPAFSIGLNWGSALCRGGPLRDPIAWCRTSYQLCEGWPWNWTGGGLWLGLQRSTLPLFLLTATLHGSHCQPNRLFGSTATTAGPFHNEGGWIKSVCALSPMSPECTWLAPKPAWNSDVGGVISRQHILYTSSLNFWSGAPVISSWSSG